MAKVRITGLGDNSDDRGSSFAPRIPIDRLGPRIVDIHLATIRPGHVRGNHYHRDHFELLLILYADDWSLHWDDGPDTRIQSREFKGAGAVMVEIDPLASHAVRNDGQADLQIVGLANKVYDPTSPDAIPRQVV